MSRVISSLALVAFVGFTVVSLVREGFGGLTDAIGSSWLSLQIFIDLVLAILFWAGWVVKDARSQGRSPWGWVLLALVAGSISPLAYAATYGRWPGRQG